MNNNDKLNAIAYRLYQMTGRVVEDVHDSDGSLRFDFDGDVHPSFANAVKQDTGWFARVHGRSLWVSRVPVRHDYGEAQRPIINIGRKQ